MLKHPKAFEKQHFNSIFDLILQNHPEKLFFLNKRNSIKRLV